MHTCGKRKTKIWQRLFGYSATSPEITGTSSPLHIYPPTPLPQIKKQTNSSSSSSSKFIILIEIAFLTIQKLHLFDSLTHHYSIFLPLLSQALVSLASLYLSSIWLWMVEISSNLLMISSFHSRGISLSSSLSFASCREGWYYRCLGIDPWRRRTSNHQILLIFLK